jgi:hypothetical protein
MKQVLIIDSGRSKVYEFVGLSGKISYAIKHLNEINRKFYWEEITIDKFNSLKRKSNV